MHTLLMRLVAPMQSWGVASNFTVRDTGLEPSKSGVIGLLCAALGRARGEPLADLAALRMGVRVDREGTLRSDYQIAQQVLQSDGKSLKSGVTSNRYYLADAAFLVGLEGEDLPLLEKIQAGLQRPVWPLFLGRKAFPPAALVWLPDGLRRGQSLEYALKNCDWVCSRSGGDALAEARLVLEDPDGSQIRQDVPLSFLERRFSSRRVTTTSYQPTPGRPAAEVSDESLKTDA